MTCDKTPAKIWKQKQINVHVQRLIRCLAALGWAPDTISRKLSFSRHAKHVSDGRAETHLSPLRAAFIAIWSDWLTKVHPVIVEKFTLPMQFARQIRTVHLKSAQHSWNIPACLCTSIIYRVKGGRCSRHCSTLLMKHVCPRFRRPALRLTDC